MLRSGDYSMIKVWAGLEARRFFTVSVEEVSLLIFLISIYHNSLTHSQVDRCVKYDQLSPNL